MNPHQRNKVDINSLSAEEQRLFRMYGKLPNKKDLLQNKLKERKYFDSGDYALSKAGKASDVGVTQIGREHPNPENIPHLSSSPHNNSAPTGQPGSFPIPSNAGGTSGSPVKESSYLNRQTSVDDQPDDEPREGGEIETPGKSGSALADIEGSVSPPPKTEGVPIRSST